MLQRLAVVFLNYDLLLLTWWYSIYMQSLIRMENARVLKSWPTDWCLIGSIVPCMQTHYSFLAVTVGMQIFITVLYYSISRRHCPLFLLPLFCYFIWHQQTLTSYSDTKRDKTYIKVSLSATNRMTPLITAKLYIPTDILGAQSPCTCALSKAPIANFQTFNLKP